MVKLGRLRLLSLAGTFERLPSFDGLEALTALSRCGPFSTLPRLSLSALKALQLYCCHASRDVAIDPADLPGLEALLVYDSRLSISRAAIKALREQWGERLRVGAPR